MAKILKEMPDGAQTRRYPWKKWLDGRVWELEVGEDFGGERESFRTYAHAVAARKGKRVITRRTKQGVAIQAVEREED